MKIPQIQLSPMQIQKKLHKMEFTYNPFRNDRAIKPEVLSTDLHVFGQQCNKTEQLKTLFNQTFMHIAETMEDAKQDNLASIIYGYLSKINSNNPELLKIIGQKALDIAVKQKDYVHIASRANSLASVYKYTDKEKYLKFLTMKRDALKEICTHYETSGNQFRTVSRLYNSKDVYALTLIRTEIEIINQKMRISPDKVRRELLDLYKKISIPDEVYRVRDANKIFELSKLKGYIQMLMSDTLFVTRTGSCETDFSKTAKKVLDAVKNKTPIQNQELSNYFSHLYDDFRDNSLENLFIKKSFTFIEDLEKLGEHMVTSKLYTVLFNKNVDNPENTKIIARHGLKQRINAKDDYGIVFFGKKLANALNATPPYSVSEYLDTVHATMVACKNIINDYDELSKTTKLKPKNDYIRQLIFGKINSAYILRKRNPDFFKEVVKEVETLFKSLPQDYLEQNPNLIKIKKIISEET